MGPTANAEPEIVGYRDCVAMRAAFESSARKHIAVERTLRIAGRQVSLRLVGEAAASWIDPALGHLASESGGGTASLTIRIFPRLELNAICGSDTGDRILASPNGRFLRQRVGGCDYLLDRSEGLLTGSIGAGADIPPWEQVKPLSVPLTTWLNDQGLSVIHAGLVARDGEGVLFAGRSGAGKSTCALACAAGGFDFLGDDCVILDLRPPRDCDGHSLYATGALDGAHLERFAGPNLAPAGYGAASRGKELIAMHGAARVRTGLEARIRAIVLPRLTDAPRSLLRRAAKGEALRSLGPSSIIKRATPAERTLTRLAMLVDLVPSYWLDMSHNPADIPDAVSTLIGGVPER